MTNNNVKAPFGDHARVLSDFAEKLKQALKEKNIRYYGILPEQKLSDLYHDFKVSPKEMVDKFIKDENLIQINKIVMMMRAIAAGTFSSLKSFAKENGFNYEVLRFLLQVSDKIEVSGERGGTKYVWTSEMNPIFSLGQEFYNDYVRVATSDTLTKAQVDRINELKSRVPSDEIELSFNKDPLETRYRVNQFLRKSSKKKKDLTKRGQITEAVFRKKVESVAPETEIVVGTAEPTISAEENLQDLCRKQEKKIKKLKKQLNMYKRIIALIVKK